jgi:hypothetical protein
MARKISDNLREVFRAAQEAPIKVRRASDPYDRARIIKPRKGKGSYRRNKDQNQ